MALQRLDACLVLVVPYLYEPVICARDEVGLVTAVVVVHAVHPLLVAVQREVGGHGSQLPHLDRPIERGAGKGVVILRVDDNLHHIMGVTLENLSTGPLLFPVPEFYQHVVTRGQDERLGRMDHDGANIVGVGFKHVHSF
uniref:Putative secreted protein n=1 Tax=Ixodes ricinus TaxID=34613 RepID=A0A6B0UT11_IXORI